MGWTVPSLWLSTALKGYGRAGDHRQPRACGGAGSVLEQRCDFLHLHCFRYFRSKSEAKRNLQVELSQVQHSLVETLQRSESRTDRNPSV